MLSAVRNKRLEACTASIGNLNFDFLQVGFLQVCFLVTASFAKRYRRRFLEMPSRSRTRRVTNTPIPTSSGGMGGMAIAMNL